MHERQQFRIRGIGLIPQSFDLLEYLTVRENICRLIKSVVCSKWMEESRSDVSLAERTGILNYLTLEAVVDR